MKESHIYKYIKKPFSTPRLLHNDKAFVDEDEGPFCESLHQTFAIGLHDFFIMLAKLGREGLHFLEEP